MKLDNNVNIVIYKYIMSYYKIRGMENEQNKLEQLHLLLISKMMMNILITYWTMMITTCVKQLY